MLFTLLALGELVSMLTPIDVSANTIYRHHNIKLQIAIIISVTCATFHHLQTVEFVVDVRERFKNWLTATERERHDQ